MDSRTVLHKIFAGFLDSIGASEDPTRFTLSLDETQKTLEKTSEKFRSTAMGRVYEQLYASLQEAEGGWAYPLDVYVGDSGQDLFALVSQSGKLFQVPLTVSKDSVSLGSWTQVEETFTPVSQTKNNFLVKRQKDGTYRWLCIAATSVLNRVGEIDSAELFDSFIRHAERTGEYPRLDFYHLGSLDTDKWEFGTADYLAREGVCYIASGTFDKGHPLAEATIRACEREPGVWGNSVEFYALAQAEKLRIGHDIEVPIYKRGKNTRISVVLEEDAAGLFTRIGVNEEVKRTMDDKIKDVLKRLYGDDEAGLESFIDSVDGVNRTVKDDKLIHRSKTGEEAAVEVVEETVETEESEEFELDDEAIAAISQQMTETDAFKALTQSVTDIKQLVGELVVGRDKDQKEIQELRQEVTRLSKTEDEKKTEYLQDLPQRKRTHITHRPRLANDEQMTGESMENAANRTLNGISAASRY